jgi:glycosyltransferase involved in cell wall biosynthesis
MPPVWSAPMRVAFVLPTLAPSGGVHVAIRHARLLRERRGWETAVVVDEVGASGAIATEPVPVLDVAGALAERWNVVVATWWTTWAVAVELDARRRVVLLQGLDERFYDWRAPLHRLAAAAALAGADAIVAVSAHLRDVALAARPGAAVHVVRNGLDRATFAPPPPAGAAGAAARSGGPLEVLVEGQRNLPLKGVDDAVAAVRAMAEPARSTLVALDPTVVDGDGVDRVVGGVSPADMAALYARSDVVLKLSRAEGLGLPPLEAAAVGTPSVVTPYGGHEDWLRHGINGVQVGFDDVAGAAAWLDALARDRDLLAALRRGALETARSWPSVEESADAMAAALEAIAAAESPDGADAARAVARAVARHVELGASGVDRIKREHAARHMELLVSSRTYRVAEAMRRAWWLVARRAGRR